MRLKLFSGLKCEINDGRGSNRKQFRKETNGWSHLEGWKSTSYSRAALCGGGGHVNTPWLCHTQHTHKSGGGEEAELHTTPCGGLHAAEAGWHLQPGHKNINYTHSLRLEEGEQPVGKPHNSQRPWTHRAEHLLLEWSRLTGFPSLGHGVISEPGMVIIALQRARAAGEDFLQAGEERGGLQGGQHQHLLRWVEACLLFQQQSFLLLQPVLHWLCSDDHHSAGCNPTFRF